MTRRPGGATRTDVLVELHVPDLEVAKRFYRRFGFAVDREEDAHGGNGYLVLRRGTSVLCFWGGTSAVADHPYFRRFRTTRKRGYAVEIVVPVDDLDSAYRTARGARCVVEPIAEQAWGARDFRIEDPFGFYVRFTEPHAVTSRSAERPDGRRREGARARRAPRAR